MNFNEIEAFAKNKEPLIGKPTYAEYTCYECLCSLYSDYKKQLIASQIAGAKKKQLRLMFETEQQRNNQYTAMLKQYQEDIRKASDLRSEINKSTDVKEIALKACECIGLMCGEMISYNLLKERINNL